MLKYIHRTQADDNSNQPVSFLEKFTYLYSKYHSNTHTYTHVYRHAESFVCELLYTCKFVCLCKYKCLHTHTHKHSLFSSLSVSWLNLNIVVFVGRYFNIFLYVQKRV